MTTTNKTFSAFTLLALIVIIIFLLLKNCSGEKLSTSNENNQIENDKVYTENIDSLEEEITDIPQEISEDEPKNNNTKIKPDKINQSPKTEEYENKKVIVNRNESQNLPPISTKNTFEKKRFKNR